MTAGGEQHGANRATNDDDEQYCLAVALWHYSLPLAGSGITSRSRVRHEPAIQSLPGRSSTLWTGWC